MIDKVGRRRPPIRRTLRELYAEHTGKVSDKWSSYLDVYEQRFSSLRDKPIRLLEIGVQNGGSLEIWREYFPRAEIVVGCDINPECGKLSFDDKKISLVVGDASSFQTAAEITACSTEYDIIIDDGSHQSSDVVCSFARYFGLLVDGGLYVAEDLHCSYWKDFGGGLYDPYSSISFFKRLADVLNKEHWGVEQEIAHLLSAFAKRYSIVFDETSLRSVHSVEFTNSLCIVKKAVPNKNELGDRKLAGQTAAVVTGVAPFADTRSTAPDETNNPWSLNLVTMEEEIETNRAQDKVHEKTIETLARDLAAARVQVGTSEEALAELDGELRRTREELQRFRLMIDEIHGSNSWQITKPLRALKRFVAG